jgi:alpha-beta hydrolase superfamily lysophospholipase
MRVVAYFLVGYGVMVGLAYLMQQRMTYFPERQSLPDLKSQATAAGLKLWPSDDADYLGLIGAQDPMDPKGTVVVFHGNAGAAVHRFYYARALERLGYRVVVAEYPGYGAKPGRPGEKAFASAAGALVQTVHAQYGQPIYLLGESLGCGVATAVAAQPPLPIKGVILVTPWNSLPQLAQKLYWYLPARWLVRERYDNVANLAQYPGPVAVVMAGNDEIVPPSLSEALYAALSNRKEKWVFAGAGHNTWPAGPREAWWREVMAFMTSEQ